MGVNWESKEDGEIRMREDAIAALKQANRGWNRATEKSLKRSAIPTGPWTVRGFESDGTASHTLP